MSINVAEMRARAEKIALSPRLECCGCDVCRDSQRCAADVLELLAVVERLQPALENVYAILNQSETRFRQLSTENFGGGSLLDRFLDDVENAFFHAHNLTGLTDAPGEKGRA